MTSTKKIDICEPRGQSRLYGYEDYFHSFRNLYKKNKLPNVILLSGQKGLGKSTFAYHFINYLLSKNEENEYSLKDFTINTNNSTFKLIQNQIHPNLFLLENILSEKDIKIDQVRNLLKFLSKSTYLQNLKIVLLDNAEYLNQNSSNALLKSLEEPSINTFFFIINNSFSRVPDTIKSRCVEYKFHFNAIEKKNIFNKIVQNYEFDFKEHNLDKFLYFDTPGNLLKCLSLLNDSKLDISKDHLSCILYLINTYKNKKNFELLNFISIFIENFYNELSFHNSHNLNDYFMSKHKILHLIDDMKKFNLDKKNLPILIERILKNETQ